MTKAYAYARMLGKLTRHSLLNRMIRVGKTHRLRARTARALDICNLRWCPHANAFHIRRQHPAPTSSRWGTIRNPTWWSRRSGPARRRPCRCRGQVVDSASRPAAPGRDGRRCGLPVRPAKHRGCSSGEHGAMVAGLRRRHGRGTGRSGPFRGGDAAHDQGRRPVPERPRTCRAMRDPGDPAITRTAVASGRSVFRRTAASAEDGRFQKRHYIYE